MFEQGQEFHSTYEERWVAYECAVCECTQHKHVHLNVYKHVCTHTALSKMEELLMEMKSDVSKLPAELSKIPTVSTQLKMDEISTISKLANKGSGDAPIINSSSVITQAPGVSNQLIKPVSVAHDNKSVKVEKDKSNVVIIQEKKPTMSSVPAQYQVAYATTNMQAAPTIQLVSGSAAPTIQLASGSAAPTIQLASGSGQLLQTPEGRIVYSAASSNNAGLQQTAIVQQATSNNTTTLTNSQTYAIGVPTYVDQVYLQGQTVQLVPVSAAQAAGQQVVYWPSMVQGGQSVGQTAGTQLAVVQGSQAFLQPVVAGTTTANGVPIKSSGGSIITID